MVVIRDRPKFCAAKQIYLLTYFKLFSENRASLKLL